MRFKLLLIVGMLIVTSILSGQEKSLSEKGADAAISELLGKRRKATFEELWDNWDNKEIIKSGEHTMKFYYKVVGEMPEDGRALYISMHGGGGTTADVNDGQWMNQIRLYTPQEGVYFVPRSPTDTWNMWHQGYMDGFIEKIIEMMTVYEGVNPNKVYIMGYSAGGDGTYQLAPRLADLWAAAAMSAGHPGDAQIENLRNLPFAIYMGGRDTPYDRNKHAKTWGDKLYELAENDKGAYINSVNIYPQYGHWMQRADSVSMSWMPQFVRNPYPNKVIWIQDDVIRKNFYWLEATEGAKAGDKLVVRYQGNNIYIDESTVKSFIISLNDKMMNLNKKVKIYKGDKIIFSGKVKRYLSNIERDINNMRDEDLIFPVKLMVTEDGTVSELGGNSNNNQLTKVGKKMLEEYSIGSFTPFKKRLDTLNRDIAEKGVLFYAPHKSKLLTGYSYKQVYDWDAYFENLYLSYYGVSDYCFSNVKSFLRLQEENGYVPRSIDRSSKNQQFKPFLAQMAELGSRQTGDYLWLQEIAEGNETYFRRLEKSIEFWFEHQDFDKNGLPVWNSADHSGMDNQVSRAGYIGEFKTEGVDLATYLYREYKAMEYMADKLNLKDEKSKFNQKAEILASKINSVFWSEEDGIYYDRNEKSGETIKVKCVSAFIPMWAGIANKEQAERLVNEHITNPDEFWVNYPIATYSKTEPDYNPGNIMRGDYTVCNWMGTAWIPTNYMVFQGLRNYGYDQVAQKLATKTIELVYKNNEFTREFYDSTTGKGLGLSRFWGWSSLGYFFPLEMLLNYDPSKIGAKIIPIATEHLGLTFPATLENPLRSRE